MSNMKCAVCAIHQEEYWQVRDAEALVEGTLLCLRHARQRAEQFQSYRDLTNLGPKP